MQIAAHLTLPSATVPSPPTHLLKGGRKGHFLRQACALQRETLPPPGSRVLDTVTSPTLRTGVHINLTLWEYSVTTNSAGENSPEKGPTWVKMQAAHPSNASTPTVHPPVPTLSLIPREPSLSLTFLIMVVPSGRVSATEVVGALPGCAECRLLMAPSCFA